MQAVLFDMDGVLVDSIPLYLEGWSLLYEALKLPRPDFHALNGKTTLAIVEEIGRLAGVQPEQILAERKRSEAEIAQQARLMPEAADTILSLSTRFKLGLGTSATSDCVRLFDSSLHFLNWFSAWVSSDMVERGKPAPDIYIELARRLGVQPEECVVIEDAANGIAAAKAAGMKAIALINPLLSIQDLHKADAAVEHLGEITHVLIEGLHKA